MDKEIQGTESQENLVDTGAEQEVETQDQESVQQQQPEKKKGGGDLSAALREERNERKRLSAEVKSYRERQDKLDARLKAVFSEEQPAEQEAQFEEDPASHLKNKTNKLEKGQEEIQNFFKQQKAMQELTSYAQNNVSEFKKEAPDYDQAYEFIRGERIKELMAINDCEEGEAAQLVNQEELNFTIQCAQKGRNAAKALFAYAKQRGYKAAEGDEAEESPEAKKLTTIAKGMASSKSLSSAAGKSNQLLTAEALAAMSDEEFSEFKAKNPRKFREIMGATSQ